MCAEVGSYGPAWASDLLRFTLKIHGLAYPFDMLRSALRLLLAVCLVLNGIGNAMAAVAMPAMAGGASHALLAMPDSDPQSADACDDAERPAVAKAASLHHPAPSTAHPADCDLDCCAQGACSCPCVQLAQAALPDLHVSSAPPGCARGVATLDLGHATPLLLSLIRPPIG